MGLMALEFTETCFDDLEMSFHFWEKLSDQAQEGYWRVGGWYRAESWYIQVAWDESTCGPFTWHNKWGGQRL